MQGNVAAHASRRHTDLRAPRAVGRRAERGRERRQTPAVVVVAVAVAAAAAVATAVAVAIESVVAIAVAISVATVAVAAVVVVVVVVAVSDVALVGPAREEQLRRRGRREKDERNPRARRV